jgi:dienelactone hydrolase
MLVNRISTLWRLLSVVGLSMVVVPVGAAVKGEAVEYKAGGAVMKGYLAYDDAAKGKRPGVLVVHEWWGHNEHARDAARKLAEAGFVALAVDMYGDGKTAEHPKDAGAFSGEVMKNMGVMQERFAAARAVLTKQPNVDAKRIGAVGFCFGGSVVLARARQGEDLRAVATFHANLATQAPAQQGKFKPKVLVLTGAADPMIDAPQVAAFEQEMKAAGVDYRVVSYPGAKHGFTNPEATAYGQKFNIPLAYDAEAAQKSWAEAIAFLQRTLR